MKHLTNEPRRHWRGSFVLILFVLAASPARQFGPDRHVGVDVSMSYFDMLRQHSDRFAITAFASSMKAAVTIAGTSDSVSLALRRDRTYTSFENSTARWQTSFDDNFGSIDVDWAGRAGPFSITAGFRFYSRSGSLLGSPHVSLSAGLFDSTAVVSAGIRHIPNIIQNEIVLQDYFAPFDETLQRWKWSYSLELFPASAFQLIVTGTRTFGDTPGRDGGYGMLLETSDGSGAADLRWRLSPNMLFSGGGRYEETSSPVALLSDNALFSKLSDKVYSRAFNVGLFFPAFGMPWETFAHYVSWNGRFIGHVESWPFTPLAASMFQNRLNIRGGGTLSVSDISMSGKIPTGPGVLRIATSSNWVRANLAIEHWEPEFLVFGVKNYRRDPLGITFAYLQNIEIAYGLSLGGLQWTIGVSQLVPVTVRYSTAAPPGAPSTPSAASRVRLDGGRRYSVSVGL